MSACCVCIFPVRRLDGVEGEGEGASFIYFPRFFFDVRLHVPSPTPYRLVN